MTQYAEPWYHDENADAILDAKGVVVANRADVRPSFRDMARIVACVNACQGLDDETLADLTDAVTVKNESQIALKLLALMRKARDLGTLDGTARVMLYSAGER